MANITSMVVIDIMAILATMETVAIQASMVIGADKAFMRIRQLIIIMPMMAMMATMPTIAT